MIPDFALIRDRATGWRKKIYARLSLGWQGTPKQWHRLESAMHIMALAILPIAVSVHTIVSFDFSMAVVPMWHSTIFGPYFVAGAIFSGIAALIIVMAMLRKALHLEDYLLPLHFQNLGKLLLLMSLLWGYFVFNERLTVWYGNSPHEMDVFWSTQTGAYAPLFWTMVLCNFVIPFPLLAIRRLRSITTAVIASCGVVAGMWLERFLIIVPSLSRKSTLVLVGHLHAGVAGNRHHDCVIRSDGAAVRARFEVRADHFDLGTESWRTSQIKAAASVREEKRSCGGADYERDLRVLQDAASGATCF